MALRSTIGFSLGAGRFLPCLSAQISRELQACASPSRDDQPAEVPAQGPAQRQEYIRDKLKMLSPRGVGLGFACQLPSKEETPAAQPSLSGDKACSSRAAPVLPARPLRRPLLPGMPRLAGAPSHLLFQRRNYNAWSPAQRYFVEGDHVVAAEASRTFQFTGLDSGSFYPYVIATGIATAISTVFIVLPLVVAPSRVDLDKSSAYECGFDAFGEARQTFSVSFYLVSIMYLLFDIEIAYLFPYAMTHASMPMYWTMNLFLAILVAGFIYEWGMGALEWRE